METQKKKYGIKGLLLVITIGLMIEEGRKKAMADGDFELHESSYFIGPVMQGFSGFETLKEIPNEIQDLDDAESVQLYSKIASDFNIEKSQVDEKIKSGLRLGMEAYRFFQIVTGRHPDFQEA